METPWIGKDPTPRTRFVLLAISTVGLTALTAWSWLINHFQMGHAELLWLPWCYIIIGWAEIIFRSLKRRRLTLW